jgi:NADPH2:quinone reductase
MTARFTAYRIHQKDGRISAGFEQLSLDDLTEGDVLIKASYSGVNYKDALAATGKGKILRRFPLNGGIDVAGEVVLSADRRYQEGDKVLITGCGLGEEYDGGYAEYVRAQGDWVIPLPSGITEQSAMALGTAGFTAALAIHRLEENGQRPDGGLIVVTGAIGGVGSLAVNMLAGRGYDVVAVTGKRDAREYLTGLGAKTILLRQDIDYGQRPLDKARWAGAIDSAGGDMLAWLTRTVNWWGNIASIGLAGGHELNTTVMPFILRGVSLLGINSVATPRALRLKVWERAATDLNPTKLDAIATETIVFERLPETFHALLDNRHTGRTVVKID